jgi:putative ABC transport system substrate-binding protein
LKGDRPVDVPVMLPTRLEFLINPRTGKAQGIEIPPTLLAIADPASE